MRRGVITGISGITSLGNSWAEVGPALYAGRSGIRYMAEWEDKEDLTTRLGGPADHFSHENIYPRQKARSMGRVATMMVYNSERALEQAGLLNDPLLKSGRVGVAAGSSFGSTPPIQSFVGFMETGKSSPA